MLTIIAAVLCALWGYQQRPFTWPLATIAAALAVGFIGFLGVQQGRAAYGLGTNDPIIWLLSAAAINGVLGLGAYAIALVVTRRTRNAA